jgi:DinB family protein
LTPPRLARPQADEYAPFYAGYIARVPEGDVLELLARQAKDTQALLSSLTPDRASYRYQPGKWSVTELVGHLCDAERIFAYRALCFARGDVTSLPGFDEAAYVPMAGFERRGLADVLGELRCLREATLFLFRGLDDDAGLRRGTANGSPMTTRAAAYVIAGHERHHLEVLRTRYGVGAG